MPGSTQLPPLPAAVPEKLVMAKELTELFLRQGVPIHYHYARAIIAQCPQSVHARYVRFSDAWAWWSQFPGFRPFSVKKAKPARPRVKPARAA